MTEWYRTETTHRRETEQRIETGVNLLTEQLNQTERWTKTLTHTVEHLDERAKNIERAMRALERFIEDKLQYIYHMFFLLVGLLILLCIISFVGCLFAVSFFLKK